MSVSLVGESCTPVVNTGIRIAFGGRLRDLRQQAGTSLAEFARRCNISQYQLQQLETGESEPDLQMLHCLSSTLHLSVSELLSGL